MRRWWSFLIPILLVMLPIVSACADEEAAPSTTGAATSCQDAFSWDAAYKHVGERATVRGPVMSPRYASDSPDQPTFLDMGRPDPDPDRFTVVIWGEDRGNFPEPPEQAYDGKTICVTGVIETDEGRPLIIADSPSDIEIAE